MYCYFIMSLFIFVFTFSLIFISLSVSVKGVMQCFPHIVILNERLSVGSSTPHQSYWTDLWRQARKMHNAKCKMANAKCIMMNLSLLNSYWTDLWGQASKMQNDDLISSEFKTINIFISTTSLGHRGKKLQDDKWGIGTNITNPRGTEKLWLHD